MYVFTPLLWNDFQASELGPLEERMKLVIHASKEAHEIASQSLPELKQTLPKEEYEVMMFYHRLDGTLLPPPFKHFVFTSLCSLRCHLLLPIIYQCFVLS